MSGPGHPGGVPTWSDCQPDPTTGCTRVFRVTTTSVADAADGLCSLTEAIAAAGQDAAPLQGEACAAGSPADVVALAAGTYAVPATLALSHSVEVRGAGMDDVVVAFGGAAAGCGVRLATDGAVVWFTHLTLREAVTRPLATPLTGVCVAGGTARVRHARVTGFSGGGLRAEALAGSAAKLEIYNALIDENRNPSDGGGVAFVGAASAISIDQSSLVNNTSDGDGGGLFASGGSNADYIYNTTFSGNRARRGGGVAARIPALTYFGLYWSTVAYNHALEGGGGLDIQGDSPDAHGTTTGSLIAGNSADGALAEANLNAAFAPGFSCTSSLLDVAGLSPPPLNTNGTCRYDVADAKLGPLMDMGGADHLPLHALLPGSPAIDATDDYRLEHLVEQRDTWNGVAGDPPIGPDPGDTPAWSMFGGGEDRNPLSDMGAYELDPRWETELLVVADLAGGAGHEVVALPSGFSHGAGTALRATGPSGSVTYQVPVPQAGTHAITARIATGSALGQFQLQVGDALAGPYAPVGAVQDGYAATDGWSTLELGRVDFASFGRKFFKFVTVGKNGDSAGYDLVLDFLEVTKS